MKIVEVKLSKSEYKLLKEYCDLKSTSSEQALKDAFFDKLEDEYDIECANMAYTEYLKDTQTFSSEEVKKILG